MSNYSMLSGTIIKNIGPEEQVRIEVDRTDNADPGSDPSSERSIEKTPDGSLYLHLDAGESGNEADMADFARRLRRAGLTKLTEHGILAAAVWRFIPPRGRTGILPWTAIPRLFTPEKRDRGKLRCGWKHQKRSPSCHHSGRASRDVGQPGPLHNLNRVLVMPALYDGDASSDHRAAPGLNTRRLWQNKNDHARAHPDF
jgi:hypothetical protein